MRFAILADLLALLMLISSAAAESPPTDTGVMPGATGAMPGNSAPDFTLTDLKGASYSLSNLTKGGKTVVLEWFNPQCPIVQKFRANSTFMQDTAATFADKPVVWLAIDSSAPGKQGGDPKVIAGFVKQHKMS